MLLRFPFFWGVFVCFWLVPNQNTRTYAGNLKYWPSRIFKIQYDVVPTFMYLYYFLVRSPLMQPILKAKEQICFQLVKFNLFIQHDVLLTRSNNQFQNYKSWIFTTYRINQIAFDKKTITNKQTRVLKPVPIGQQIRIRSFGIGCWIRWARWLWVEFLA